MHSVLNVWIRPSQAIFPQGFRVLTEVSIFPEVGGQEPGLWRGISGTSYGRPRFRAQSLLDEFSISEILGLEGQRPVAFSRRPVRIRIREHGQPRRCGGHASILRGWENDHTPGAAVPGTAELQSASTLVASRRFPIPLHVIGRGSSTASLGAISVSRPAPLEEGSSRVGRGVLCAVGGQESPVSGEEYRAPRTEGRDFRGESLVDDFSISEIWRVQVPRDRLRFRGDRFEYAVKVGSSRRVEGGA